MDNKGEALYSPTQNFNDEDFKSDTDDEDKKSKKTNKNNLKHNGNKPISKDEKKSKNGSKKLQNTKTNKIKNKINASQSSSKTKSRSRSESPKSESLSSHHSSSRQQSSSKSPSSSISRERKKKSKSKSKHRHESRHHRRSDASRSSRRDESRRVSSKHRRSRSREDRKHRHVNDPYRYHSPSRHSRDHRHNGDPNFEKTHDRGGRGHEQSRGGNDRNHWRKERSEHYRDYEKKGEAWDHRAYDKYREGRGDEKRSHISRQREENNIKDKLADNHDPVIAGSLSTTDKLVGADGIVKNDGDGSLIIPKQHIKRLENFEVRPQQPHHFEPRPPFTSQQLQSGFESQQPLSFDHRQPLTYEPRHPLTFKPRPTAFEPRPAIAFEPRPTLFQANFRDVRPGMEQPSNLMQIRPNMPFNPNQPMMVPPNQQFRIIGPPRQQGGLVFRPVQIMEPRMDWRMDMNMPMISQSSGIQIPSNIPTNTAIYRGPPMDYIRHQSNRPLLPLPQQQPLPQIQIDGQGIHQRPGGSSPPPPPPPIRYLINPLEDNSRFMQPGEFNRIASPMGEANNRFNKPMIAPRQLELSNYNPSIPPPVIQQQFIVNPPYHHPPTSPQTPLQSEEQIIESSPSPPQCQNSPKQGIDTGKGVQQYSPNSMNSETDHQYDAYQDDLFADNSKQKSTSPSLASPDADDLLDSSPASAKLMDVIKSVPLPQEDQLKLTANSQEQHKLAKIAPFSIGCNKKPVINNPAVNQVFGTIVPPPPKPLSPLPVSIPGLSDSVVDSLEQLTSLLNSASAGVKSMDFNQPNFSSLASFISNQSPLQEELDIPMDLAANASQQTIQLARQLGLFELTKVLEQATNNNQATIINETSEKAELPKKKKVPTATLR